MPNSSPINTGSEDAKDGFGPLLVASLLATGFGIVSSVVLMGFGLACMGCKDSQLPWWYKPLDFVSGAGLLIGFPTLLDLALRTRRS